MKCKSFIALILALVLCLSSVSAMACTAIYVGSGLTEDGSTMFARSEDISNSYNKLAYFSPAGNHKAGEVYNGCYGFTYTFTKDSYSYTAFSDDNGAAVNGECPDCGGTHKHTPYEAGGTNEMGLTVSATETLGSCAAVAEADPKNYDTGIEEAEIPTVLLSECATAKEALALLTKIYDESGCQGGSGIFISDNTETWYIENTTGTAYIAVKLTADMAFAVPNQSVIGLIDLDDTENVIASDNLIAVAKAAGTYVGDEAANTIDYVASYNPDQTPNSRMLSALKYFNPASSDEPTAADYTISNVAADGSIVPMYTNIELSKKFGIADMIGYYDIPGIGSTSNLETHIFQVYAEDGLTDTVEWIGMDHGCYTVFVPYYPMLTTDFYAGYKLSTLPATFTQEEPTDADVYYATTGRVYVDGKRTSVEGFKALPENWADSMYWTVDALSNLCESGNVTDEQKETVNKVVEQLQNACYTYFSDMKASVAAATSDEAAAVAATETSAKIAAEMHENLVKLVNSIK